MGGCGGSPSRDPRIYQLATLDMNSRLLLFFCWTLLTASMATIVYLTDSHTQEIHTLWNIMAKREFYDPGPMPFAPPTKAYKGICSITVFPNGGNNTHSESHPTPFAALKVARVAKAEAVILAALPRLGYKAAENGTYYFVLRNSSGLVVDDMSQCSDDALYYVQPSYEHWFWPGVYVGYETPLYGVRTRNGTPLILKTISLRPRAFTIENFLNDEEAEAIVASARPYMERSGVYLSTQDSAHKSEVRTSDQAWLLSEDPIAVTLDKRLTDLTKVDVATLGERIQVVHYGPYQHYHAHHDYFDPKAVPDREDLQRGRNRMITVLYYLNDVPEGGKTIFPKAGPTGYGLNPVTDFSKCTQGVAVTPVKGRALMFYSLDVDGHMQGVTDDWSLHGGCDVISGEKWASNKWIYNHPPDFWTIEGYGYS